MKKIKALAASVITLIAVTTASCGKSGDNEQSENVKVEESQNDIIKDVLGKVEDVIEEKNPDEDVIFGVENHHNSGMLGFEVIRDFYMDKTFRYPGVANRNDGSDFEQIRYNISRNVDAILGADAYMSEFAAVNRKTGDVSKGYAAFTLGENFNQKASDREPKAVIVYKDTMSISGRFIKYPSNNK